jgi:DNA-binding NtrC family response regulator
VDLNDARQYQIEGFDAVVCSDSMRRLMQMVERVARSNASVLISGETGCGKEFIARALHHYSLRHSKPWVDLNCAALPEHLVESELFGYEKGAFSGADTAKPGLFELANGGTLFLDEIGELEPKVQVKLLRVLDGMPYYRLGGNKKVAVDVRVIAATNQKLDVAVKSGRFRNDLYHRLSQFQLRVPPLRERPEDLRALADYFLRQNSPGSRISAAAMALISNYRWPGNVRELRNVMIQVSLTMEGSEVKPADLPAEITVDTTLGSGFIVENAAKIDSPCMTDLEQLEKQAILRSLARTGGHQGMAAEQLGISRRTLSRKLKLYNLNPQCEGAGDSLGLLNREQQQYFRAAVEIPVAITNGRGDKLEVRSVNLSSGGMCVDGVENPFLCTGTLDVRFPMPETGTWIEVKAKVAWADVEKKAGLRFTDVSAEAQNTLDRWLREKQHEEGWSVAV